MINSSSQLLSPFLVVSVLEITDFGDFFIKKSVKLEF